MFCYRDMTFCCAPCKNTKCGRHYGEDVRRAAKAWWDSTGIKDDGPPVAFSDFSGKCADYDPGDDDTEASKTRRSMLAELSEMAS